jgi:hypothetical protein
MEYLLRTKLFLITNKNLALNNFSKIIDYFLNYDILDTFEKTI